jgi:hypothetical protein
MKRLGQFALLSLRWSPVGLLALVAGIIPAFLTQHGGYKPLDVLVYVLWAPSFAIPWQHREWWNMALVNAAGYGIGFAAFVTLLRTMKKEPIQPPETTHGM